MPMNNIKEPIRLCGTANFIQQNVFFWQNVFSVVSSTVLWCNPAGSVAVSGCSSRPLSVNEFWEMLSEIRSPAVCRREMLSSTAAFTKTNPAPWSSVCLPVTTIEKTRRAAEAITPLPTEPAIYHRSPQTQGSKKRRRRRRRKREAHEKCVHGPIKTPLWDPFPPCSCRVITITTPHSALSKRLSDTSLPPYLSSHTPSTPPSGIASLPPSPTLH